MLHFGRRGRENLRQLQRSDFAVQRDGEGSLYVYKTRDEQTKNHQSDDNRAEGRMYEIRDSDRCPVRSFVKFVKRLSPNCPFLFQKPRNRPENGVYYHNVVVGQNKLGSMMSEISDRAKLSIRYTNHSLRATTVHILDKAQVPSRHIMTITGHKSENSLKTYSGLTDEGTKKRMSNVISMQSCAVSTSSTSTVNPLEDIDMNRKSCAVSSTSTVNQLEDTDLLNIIENINESSVQEVNMQSLLDDGLDSLYQNIDLPTGGTMQSLPPFPCLFNCTNVTINYTLPTSHLK